MTGWVPLLEFILIIHIFLRGSGGGWYHFIFGGMGSGWGLPILYILLAKNAIEFDID
jgi:hypothetical protein